MAIDLVKNDVVRFLSTPLPEVISINGRWGVGKTFAWNKYLQEAQRADNIALKRYSYVSLFGLNSLEQLKYSIFENTVQCKEIGGHASIETLGENAGAIAERFGRK